MKDLLKKWINGNVTWSEEKKLRQATEKDYFLAEAMEGYDAFPVSDHAAKIEQLKGRFRKEKKEEKGMVFTLSRVAAAAAVIGVIGTFFWIQSAIEEPAILSQNIEQSEVLPFEQNEAENIAVEEIISSDEPTEPIGKNSKSQITKPIIQPIKEQTSQPLAKNTKPKEQPKQQNPSAIVANKEMEERELAAAARRVETPVIVPENLPIEADESAIVLVEREAPATEPNFEATSVPPPAADIAYSTRSIPANPVPQASARKSKAKKKQVKEASKVNTYVGLVRNEDGQPMDAAKIEGLNTSFNTISEQNGEFTLVVDSPLTRIAVSKDGFHTRKIDLNQYSDFLNIALVRKATFPENEAALKAELLEPKPATGFIDFLKYLENNQIYPTGAKEKGIERAVEIQFYIDENGTPTNLKVVNPDLHGFDKEAIRLLENGPKWTPINSSVRYYIPFELE